MNNRSILIIEDNRLLRDGLSAILQKHAFTISAAIGNGKKTLSIMKELKPDVILLDLGLTSRNSLDLVKSIKKGFPETKIIIMDLIPLQKDVLDFVRVGVDGFTLKDVSVADFINTIKSVLNGARILPINLTNSLFSQIIENAAINERPNKVISSVRMTKRERQVIELISEGLSNHEAANTLHLSIHTIKSHVHNILEKLSLHTRIQIAGYAYATDEYKTAMNTTSLIGE